jgi:uncharacterized protein YeaO (DUF488 family)
MVTIKRIYEPAAEQDGYRVMVDRLWPRGVSKDKAAIDLWLKEAAPSPDLRKWFNHDPARFDEFAAKYREELTNNPAFDELRQLLQDHQNVTLLYAARDENVNHAVVLRDFLTS